MALNSALTREDLWSLEDYARVRPEFRARVLEHKKLRRVSIGDHATLLFESRLTIHYQVQEMLRVERIFEAEEIQEELEAFLPLIPDGSNFKATLLIEYPDPEERRRELAKLMGVEHRVSLRVVGDASHPSHDRVYAIADEDLERSTDDKTSAVHFLRFELDREMVKSLKSGTELEMGIDHPVLTENATVSAETLDSLISDLA